MVFFKYAIELSFSCSYVKPGRWLIWEDLLLNADDWAVHGVINIWQVTLSWALSDSAEFVVYGSVAQANPSLVSTDVWHGNATQMGANGRAHQHLGTDVGGQRDHRSFIQERGWRSRVTLFDFAQRESSDENNLSVPGGLKHLTWWKLANIEFLIGVSDISSSVYHLVVHGQEYNLQPNHVRGEDEPLQHVQLGSSDFVVSVGLVPHSVFVEPVVDLGFGVERIAEVGWSR